MEKKQNLATSTPEMVTISRAEYEKFQAQSQKISALEQQLDILMEALLLGTGGINHSESTQINQF